VPISASGSRGFPSGLTVSRSSFGGSPELAPHLTLPVPEPVASGEPEDRYPSAWAVYRWVPGETFTRRNVVSEREAAEVLARFVTELRRIDTAGAPRSTRDDPIDRRRDETARAIEELAGAVDTDAVTAVWESSVRAPRWDGDPVWTHGDLLPTNLLVLAGELSAVIDFGLVGVGDPAVDLIPAWTMFGPEGRRAFRDAIGVDEGSWARARGFALHQALLIIPYYRDTDPGFVVMAQRTIDEVVADHGG
jgi:aminoglycoside phosphotransferase (APT) family kinase protein